MSAPATPADERLDLLAPVQRATNYVLGVVLFAAALFFAGMSARPATPRLRRILLAFGVILFVGTVGWIATLPITSRSDVASA
jgi:hypothetical protein